MQLFAGEEAVDQVLLYKERKQDVLYYGEQLQ